MKQRAGGRAWTYSSFELVISESPSFNDSLVHLDSFEILHSPPGDGRREKHDAGAGFAASRNGSEEFRVGFKSTRAKRRGDVDRAVVDRGRRWAIYDAKDEGRSLCRREIASIKV